MLLLLLLPLRYTLQLLLHSLPQAAMLTGRLAALWSTLGPAMCGLALHALAAHLVNLGDKGARAARQLTRARAAGLSLMDYCRLLLLLRGGSRVHPRLRRALQVGARGRGQMLCSTMPVSPCSRGCPAAAVLAKWPV